MFFLFLTHQELSDSLQKAVKPEDSGAVELWDFLRCEGKANQVGGHR